MVRVLSSFCRGLMSSLTCWVSSAILPKSVAIPILTTTPTRLPLTSEVPEKTMSPNSKWFLPVGSMAWAPLVDRVDFASQGRLVDLDLGGRKEPDVGGHVIALLELDDVANDQVAGEYLLVVAVTHDP